MPVKILLTRLDGHCTGSSWHQLPRGVNACYCLRTGTHVIGRNSRNLLYTFWIAADDMCELWLGTDFDPANKVRIAYHNNWTERYDWDKNETQESVPITLEAGEIYYIEAIFKEHEGDDNCAVAWQGPGIPNRVVIPGSYLSPVHDGECSSIAYHVSGLSEQLTLGSRLEITLSGAPVDAADLPCEPGAASEYVFNHETELDKAIAGIRLNYFGARYYDPEIGVWLTADAAVQFWNLYGYPTNPIGYIDEDGNCAWLLVPALAIGGAYLGGAAANQSFDLGDWDRDAETAVLMFIGGVGGAMGGYMLAGVIGGGSVSVSVSAGFQTTYGAVSAGFNLTADAAVSLSGVVWEGVGATGWGAIGAGAAIAGGYSLYNRCLQTFRSGFESDVSFGASYTHGSGSADPVLMYGLNMNTPAGMNTYKSSFTYGHLWYRHSETGWTDQGYIGFRAGNVSGYYHNDTRIPPSFGIKSTDQGWTAGASISYRSRHGSVDIYHEHFTTIDYKDREKQNGHEYWKQSSHDRACNRAITAVRHRMREYAVSGAPWGQNFVHDRLTEGPRFHYPDYQ